MRAGPATRRLVPAGLLILAGLSACRAPAAPEVPAEVRQAVAREFAAAGIGADALDRSPGLFRAVDLSAQAAPDWLVDFGTRPDGRLCGTGGCPVQVWVRGAGGHYRLALSRQALGHEVVRHGSGRRWLALDLHGALCGETGSAPCRYHFEWRGNADDPEGHFAAASVWGRPLRYQGPLLQALPPKPPAASPMAAAVADYRAACAAAGGQAGLADALARLPDLNQDGRPEWWFDADQATCLKDDEPVSPGLAGLTRLFASAADGTWREAWSGAPVAYAVDFSLPAARLLIRPAGCEANCTEQALAWQAAERRFVPGPTR